MNVPDQAPGKSGTAGKFGSLATSGRRRRACRNGPGGDSGTRTGRQGNTYGFVMVDRGGPTVRLAMPYTRDFRMGP